MLENILGLVIDSVFVEDSTGNSGDDNRRDGVELRRVDWWSGIVWARQGLTFYDTVNAESYRTRNWPRWDCAVEYVMLRGRVLTTLLYL